ncbi:MULTISPECIES: MocR-like pyridoxine biosynthesis transcription factor PdxR [Streptomyces]|uniref:MocR-like pyridoxine biosynthesis transcription factor PdxR n=1 Tax=Streptomyces TaxID=1883 RepID=UPI00163BB3A3|nr:MULTISPECIES: PLP-dependent aminotransferase family protein [Streptomyces]MBC2874495.1 PLP-dependent aminotransferase family protein [Streptomyces sp. TYQ1024]UBI36730.1 PLP-dependent aminotransferase family protein [Streptomyces mobaraensis]UKW29322.1 PLP-dependent aminotransferase family protein [Streptomyces sp. TYQ1024]
MSTHLQVTIDRTSGEPLREQLRTRIRDMITTGILRAGTPLPSSRRLAADLRLSRSVVVEVYQQLTAEGYLHTVDRSGTRVADWGITRSSATVPACGRVAPPAAVSTPVRWDLRTGLADATGFPRREWLFCVEKVLRTMGSEHLEYPPPEGVAEVREELAAYLGRVRAVRAMAHHVMMTAGFSHGLSLVCRLLLAEGHRSIGVEDPGHPGQRQFIESAGLRAVPVPVDGQGIVVEALARSGTRAVLVTPAHQFPTGVALTDERRSALVSWARAVDGIVVEDDFDSEFWFDVGERPLSLQAAAPEHVIHGSSASKLLAPFLRLGWLTVPSHLVAPFSRTRARLDIGTSSVDQLTFAEFVRGGRLDRHLRRMRKRHQERRRALTDALARYFPGAAVQGAAAGRHSLVSLPRDLDERTVTRAARQSGVLVRGLGDFTVRPPSPFGPCLVVGHAAQTPHSLATAVQLIAQAVRV